jgi:hypothetical protein
MKKTLLTGVALRAAALPHISCEAGSGGKSAAEGVKGMFGK